MGIETDAFVRSVDPLFGGTWVLFWLVVGWFAPKLRPLRTSRALLVGLPLLQFAGTVALIVSNRGETIDHAGWIVGLVLSAMGSAGVALLWGELFSSASRERAASSIVASFALAAFFSYLVMNLRASVALVMTALLPLFSGAILWLTPEVWNAAPPQREMPGRPSILYKWLLWAVAIGAAFGLSNGITQADVSSLYYSYYLVSGGAIALVVLLLDRFLPKSLEYAAVYRVVGPLMVAGLLLLSLPSRYLSVAQIAIAASWVLVRMLTWIVLSDLTPRLRMPAARTFAWTLAALSIGRQIGWTISSGAGQSPNKVSFIVAGAVLLVVLTASLLVKERDMAAIFGKSSARDENSPDVWSDTSSTIAEEFGLSPKQEEVVRLLLQGYDNAYIQQSLYIAGSTLKAHLRDIYAKVGVHSRQELLALCSSRLPRV